MIKREITGKTARNAKKQTLKRKRAYKKSNIESRAILNSKTRRVVTRNSSKGAGLKFPNFPRFKYGLVKKDKKGTWSTESKHKCTQCGRDMGHEWLLGPVCGTCCRKNHAEVCGRVYRPKKTTLKRNSKRK
jgi:hypothetical protein